MRLTILITGMMILILGLVQEVVCQDITAGKVLAADQLLRFDFDSGDTLGSYYSIQLRGPGTRVGAASGSVAVVFPENPFNVAVTRDGYYLLDLYITTRGLRNQEGSAHVAWVASPDLDPVQRIGVVAVGEPLRGRVDFDNKFVVFVTIEEDPEVDRPTGRIVLSGVSRSGRMESMFSHGFCPPDQYC